MKQRDVSVTGSVTQYEILASFHGKEHMSDRLVIGRDKVTGVI